MSMTETERERYNRLAVAYTALEKKLAAREQSFKAWWESLPSAPQTIRIRFLPTGVPVHRREVEPAFLAGLASRDAAVEAVIKELDMRARGCSPYTVRHIYEIAANLVRSLTESEAKDE